MKAAIALHLQVSEQSIKEVREWAQVYLVIFHKGLGLRPRFVSKKIKAETIAARSLGIDVLEGRMTFEEAANVMRNADASFLDRMAALR